MVHSRGWTCNIEGNNHGSLLKAVRMLLWKWSGYFIGNS
jgi:hypothetical protein